MAVDIRQAQAIAAQGMQALNARNGRAAEAAFEKAMELGWNIADLWIVLSHARSLNGNPEGAHDALKGALTLEPENPRALIYMGEFLRSRGDLATARGFYEQGKSLGEAEQQKTPELQNLLIRADKALSEIPANVRHVVDEFAEAHGVGSEPEDELLLQSLDIMAGRKRAFVSQPNRYLFPGLPNRQFYRRDEFSWVPELEAQTEIIKGELAALLAWSAGNEKFTPYVEQNGREQAGSDHPLINNADWGAFYLVKQGKRQEEAIALCPKTMAAIEAIGPDAMPDPQPSVLFSRLKPGMRIPPHTGMFNTRLICHLPLIIPEKCGFRVGNDTREWREGEMFLFDDSINHEAWNESDQDRYVLIFEIWRPELSSRQRRLLSDLFAPEFGV